MLEKAAYNTERKVPRYSIVTSGKTLHPDEIENGCKSNWTIRENADITVCISFGLQNGSVL